MSQKLYINILVDWSLSGLMTSKHVIRESATPRPATSSILISRMTSSSVIIPYRTTHHLQVEALVLVFVVLTICRWRPWFSCLLKSWIRRCRSSQDRVYSAGVLVRRVLPCVWYPESPSSCNKHKTQHVTHRKKRSRVTKL